MLARGIGVHHAGVLPKYRRIVETLFQEKLLPYCVCTETLAAGINLPARSVILTTLVKGPRDKKKLIEAGTAQQIFGRAGRPQFDTEGHVIALAHEDDVKLARWKIKYDSIPEDTKDPGLMKAKKAIAKKKPLRRSGFTYWTAEQFAKLQTAPAGRLASRGNLSWRWLAYLLDANPAVEPIRQVIHKRLMPQPMIESELKRLTKMLVTLGYMGVVTLDPPPPKSWNEAIKPVGVVAADEVKSEEDDSEEPVESVSDKPPSAADVLLQLKMGGGVLTTSGKRVDQFGSVVKAVAPAPEPYDPITATPTPRLKQMMVFRAVHPLYGLYLMDYLGKADQSELIQILESLLAMPGSVAKGVRVPWPDRLPPGKLSIEIVDPAILTGGLATTEDMYPPADQSDIEPELRKYPIPLAQKMRMLFENTIDHAGGLYVTPVWAAGDLLERGGNFDDFVRSRDLVKQEGILFKHFLRMILLCNEFAQLTPKDVAPADWEARLREISSVLTTTCTTVDPQSTDEMLEEMAEEVG